MSKNTSKTTNKYDPEQEIFCDGIALSTSFYEQTENRLLTLLLKGVIVYLLAMGSIGFYLSAIDASYNVLLTHIVVGIMAILCAMLYYRLLVENTGYLVLLILFGGLVYLFKTYINSGFYAIVNMSVDEMAQYLDMDIQKLYNEQIGDRYVTITFVALFIGIVIDILLNVYVSRRMQYVAVLNIVMFFNVIPLYLICEPDILYVIMLLLGIALTYVYKSGQHYSPQIAIRRDNRVFAPKRTLRKKTKEISYVYDVKGMLQTAGRVAVFVVALVLITAAIKPKDSFNVGYKGNKYKELSMVGVATFLTEGWRGFYKNQTEIGGMDSGKLGDVSTVRLDYQTDLIVEYTPYSYGTVYLRGFVADTYKPFENQWENILHNSSYDDTITPEGDALAESFENGDEFASKGTMLIRNVGGGNRQYRPYYYTNPQEEMRGFVAYDYYPWLAGNDTAVRQKYYQDEMPYQMSDLTVPSENQETIHDLVLELDAIDTPGEVTESLRAYFQKNIPYTISPGKTPRKEDFINYFLNENKKGYCVHFASTAVLVFRSLGIPARYVEGYAIDYGQVVESELVNGAKYSDYYQGYSALGETALVRVNVTDADAHAWCEIYVQGMGWQIVDVTPAGEAEEVEDFWSMFENVFGDSEDSAEEVTQEANRTKITDAMVRRMVLTMLFALFGVLIIWILIYLIRQLCYYIRFQKAGRNDKLILYYTRWLKKRQKKDKALCSCINYREQVEYILNPCKNESEQSRKLAEDEEMERKKADLVRILEQAGFSNREITEEQYQDILKWLKEV